MEASMLEETVQNPNPYPIVTDLHYDDVWQLCLQARELAWDPVSAIDWDVLRQLDLPDEVRAAGAMVAVRGQPVILDVGPQRHEERHHPDRPPVEEHRVADDADFLVVARQGARGRGRCRRRRSRCTG